jgi:hypothetical protein
MEFLGYLERDRHAAARHAEHGHVRTAQVAQPLHQVPPGIPAVNEQHLITSRSPHGDKSRLRMPGSRGDGHKNRSAGTKRAGRRIIDALQHIGIMTARCDEHLLAAVIDEVT